MTEMITFDRHITYYINEGDQNALILFNSITPQKIIKVLSIRETPSIHTNIKWS